MFFRGRKEDHHQPAEPARIEPQQLLFDAATGLFQDWYFALRGEEEVTRGARYSHPFALIIWEPRLLPGEALPDDVAAKAGQVIRSGIRKTDLAGLLGRVRFAAILVEAGYEVARSVGHRAKVELTQRARTESGSRPWRVGIAVFPEDGMEWDTILHVAERRLVEDVAAA